MSRLSLVLKKLRESRGLSMVQLSERASVGIGTIGDIERGKNGSTPKTLEKIAKGLNLTKEEREELMSTLIPEDIGKKLTKREILQKEDFLSQATLMFNDENISEDDKEKLLASLQEAFYMAKILNKRKK